MIKSTPVNHSFVTVTQSNNSKAISPRQHLSNPPDHHKIHAQTAERHSDDIRVLY